MSENPSAYQEALAACAELFQCGADVGYDFSLLDIGGGFPGEKHTDELFSRMADAINQSLSQHFSPTKYPHLRVIAEPGTYMLHTLYYAMCACMCVHTYIICNIIVVTLHE